MITFHIPGGEDFDEESSTFIFHRPVTVSLEHSLLSISKWESKWHKPFLSKDKKTEEETVDYIRCMVVGQDSDPTFVNRLTYDQISEIKKYIEDPMTATWFSEDKRPPSREIITSELIYYWMVAQQIPFECQKWHINRLLTLIKVCSIKNQPPKKMSTKSLADRNRALNAARKQKYNTSG